MSIGNPFELTIMLGFSYSGGILIHQHRRYELHYDLYLDFDRIP